MKLYQQTPYLTGYMNKQLKLVKHEGSGDLSTIIYNTTQTLFNASEDNETYLLKIKKD